MAHRLIGGLLAAATMLTPLAPAYAKADTGVGAQMSERIVLAQRDDRQDRRGSRGDHSAPTTQRSERNHGEARRQRAQAPQTGGHRNDRQDYRQERREDRHGLNQGRVTQGEYRRDYRDYRQGGASRGGHRSVRRETHRDYRDYQSDQHRYDNRRDQHSWNLDWRSDRRYDYRSHRNSYRSTYRLGRYNAPYHDYRYRRLNIGFSIGSLFYGNRYTINDPWQYRLPPAYYPYRWVRYYDDALLIDTRRGRVVDVIYGVFW